MAALPDPRRFGLACEPNHLLDLATRLTACEPDAGVSIAVDLRVAVERALRSGDERVIDEARVRAMSVAQHRVLVNALAQAIDAAAPADGDLAARAFALPIVLITAGSTAAQVPGSLSDIGALQDLFREKQALGAARNFGLSNALCTLDALETLSPAAIYRGLRMLDTRAIGDALRPEPMRIVPGREQVHLRFVIGAALSAQHAPAFTETAANIGRWGMACARLLANQLAVPGVQLLVLPRPPCNLIHARHSGRTAQLEAALNLFVSNGVRQFRVTTGDPTAVLSVHDDHDLRLTLSSPFADDMVEAFRWPLSPLDDLDAVEHTIASLLAATRVNDVRFLSRILPAQRANGAALFPRCGELDRLEHEASRH